MITAVHADFETRATSRFSCYLLGKYIIKFCAYLVPMLSAMLQAACVQLAEVDSSQSPKYRSMIGREFALKEDFHVLGVKRDLRSTEPDYILIIPAAKPGIGGPEFFDLGAVPAGSRFKIVGVIERRFKFLPQATYVADFASDALSGAKLVAVRLRDSHVHPLYSTPISPSDPPQLNERYFQALPLKQE